MLKMAFQQRESVRAYGFQVGDRISESSRANVIFCLLWHNMPVAMGSDWQSLFNFKVSIMTDTSPLNTVSARTLSESIAREQLLERIIDAAVDAVIMIDQHGVIQSVNRAFVRLFGYEDEEVIGRNVNMLMPPPYAEEHDGYLASYLATGRRKIIGIGREVIGKRKDGSVFPIDLAVSEAVVGTTRVFTGTIRDITARKRAEQELADLYKELHSLSYVVSHELQEPVSVIVSYLGLLSTRYHERLGADADEFIEKCTGSATRIQRLIDDLWNYARVDTVEKQSRDTVDFSSLIEKLVDELRAKNEIKDVIITHGDLPVILANERQMKVLFRNLLSNAIQFHGAEPAQIHVSAERQDSEWIFAVKDNGIGIDMIYACDIFRVFQRLNARSDAKNTGMGLAICKKIVEHHGGRIWVQSLPGQGSTFFVAIPDQKVRGS